MGILPSYDESLNLPIWSKYLDEKKKEDLILAIGIEPELITIVAQHCVAYIESKSVRYFALLELVQKLNNLQALVLIRDSENAELCNITFNPSLQGEWELDDNPKIFYPIDFSREYVDNLVETIL